MRDLRPDELSHVYGGENAAKTNPGKGTEKHTDRSPGKDKAKNKSTEGKG